MQAFAISLKALELPYISKVFAKAHKSMVQTTMSTHHKFF